MSTEAKGSAESTQEVTEEKVVSQKAYEDMQRDMHKYKARAKENAAKNAEYEAKLKSDSEQRLIEQEQYKEAYEKSKKEAEEYKHQAESEKSNYLVAVKRNALKHELGGNVKDVYLSHANIADIEIDQETGLVNKDSLLEVANSFRSEHGVLLGKVSGGNPTGNSAMEVNTEKSLGDLSVSERMQLLKTMKNK